MTREEINRLSHLFDKALEKNTLDFEEAKEGFDLARRLLEEYPEKPQFQMVVDLFAFQLGQAAAIPVR
jgi:hypothetical protein